MLCLDPNGDLKEVVAAMSEAIHDVVTAEITRATRSVTLDGVDVQEGELIGLVDGRLAASGEQLDELLPKLLSGMGMAEREILTIYYGRDVSENEAAGLAEQIETLYPEVEIELLPGGQAHYFYILGAE